MYHKCLLHFAFPAFFLGVLPILLGLSGCEDEPEMILNESSLYAECNRLIRDCRNG